MFITFNDFELLNLDKFSEEQGKFLKILPKNLVTYNLEDKFGYQYLTIDLPTCIITVLFAKGVFDHWYLFNKSTEKRVHFNNTTADKAINTISSLLETYQKHYDTLKSNFII